MPPSVKQPQDHQKAFVADDDHLTATVKGRDWRVPKAALDDFELLDDMSQLEQGNASRLPSVLRRLIGEQWQDAMATVRDKATGRVTVEAGAGFVSELMESLNPNS